MTGHDDDLAPWLDDPVVQALRGPGTADELAGEAEYVAAFRAAQSTSPTPILTSRDRVRRVGRRLGGGGTAVVVAVALGAGAAAAYTQNLPDPVQRAVHGVLGPVGVPGPASTSAGKTPGAGQSPKPTDEPSSPTEAATDSPSESPTESPTEAATDSPSESSTESPTETPTDSPTESPTTSPTETPTESPTDSPTVTPTLPATAVLLTGPTHRAGPDALVSLSGTVTAADGTSVAGEPVTLLQRLDQEWLPVASAASDEAGAVTLATPALTRTTVFRLAAGDDLISEEWRIVMVPTLVMEASPVASATSITVTARGAQPGDQVDLLSRTADGDVVVGRSRLSEDLTTSFRVASPGRPVTFVAQLPRSGAHASARQTLRIQPLTPETVTATAPVDVLGPRDSVTVTGIVSAADGIALAGRPVWLLLREPGADWRRVGSAISDSTGSVSIPVGPIDRNVSVRLRAGSVRSPALPLRLQPEWSTSVSVGDNGAAVISGTALGGNPGDDVLLRTVVDGRLTTVQQATLGAGGTVRFEVPLPDSRVRYRLVLARTPMHLRATTVVTVRPTP